MTMCNKIEYNVCRRSEEKGTYYYAAPYSDFSWFKLQKNVKYARNEMVLDKILHLAQKVIVEFLNAEYSRINLFGVKSNPPIQ